jgi:hypothetical protein
LAALAAVIVHPCVVAEMGSRVWRRKRLVGLAKAYSTAGGRVRVAKGGRERTCALSGPTQTRSKFGPRMGQTERVGPDTAHRWSALQRSSSPIELKWTGVNQMLLEMPLRRAVFTLRASPAVPPTWPPAAVFYIRTAVFGPVAPPVPRFPPDLGLNPSGEPRPTPVPRGALGDSGQEKSGSGPALSARERANPTIWTQIPLSLLSLLCRRRHHPSPIRRPVS